LIIVCKKDHFCCVFSANMDKNLVYIGGFTWQKGTARKNKLEGHKLHNDLNLAMSVHFFDQWWKQGLGRVVSINHMADLVKCLVVNQFIYHDSAPRFTKFTKWMHMIFKKVWNEQKTWYNDKIIIKSAVQGHFEWLTLK